MTRGEKVRQARAAVINLRAALKEANQQLTSEHALTPHRAALAKAEIELAKLTGSFDPKGAK